MDVIWPDFAGWYVVFSFIGFLLLTMMGSERDEEEV
jgi:hypothetical protein